MAKVLVICARRYNGHELWTLLKRLRAYEHTFEVVSTQTLIRDELTMQPNTIDRTIYDVNLEEAEVFDGVCVVSGNMDDTEAYWTDEQVIAILKAFKERQKVIAAICCSVPTLAVVAEGVRVSPFPLIRAKQRLMRFKAILEPTSICVDMAHKTITAENQMMSYLWGNCISEVLNGQEPKLQFQPSKYSKNFAGKTPRRLPKDLEAAMSKFRPTPAMINKKSD